MLNGLDQGLSSKVPSTRLQSAEELGDLLDNGKLSHAEVEQAARELINAACHESVQNIQEAMLNSLATLATRYDKVEAPWNKIVSLLGRLDKQCLEHALCILGLTHNRSFAEVVERYIEHSDDSIRDAARTALGELEVMGGDALKNLN